MVAIPFQYHRNKTATKLNAMQTIAMSMVSTAGFMVNIPSILAGLDIASAVRPFAGSR